MIVQHFVRWCQTASVAERCKAVAILADAVLESRFSAAESHEAGVALMLTLDDPSPKVRMALASKIAASHKASRPLVRQLAEDVEPVAVAIVAASPLLDDHDLVDLAASGSGRVQAAIARRRPLSRAVSAALAEVGGREACLDLLLNDAAVVTAPTFRKLASAHGEDGPVREALLGRPELPVDVRQTLLLEVARALSGMPLVRRTIGEAAAQRVVLEACEQTTLLIGTRIAGAEIPALVEHLRVTGQLSAAFLIRVVCTGNVDLFAAALVALSGMPARRVRSILVDGREPAFTSLLKASGLPEGLTPLFLCAVEVWKDLSTGGLSLDADDMPALVMERVVLSLRRRGDEAAFGRLEMLLHRLASETARTTARRRAERHLAAA